MATREEYAKQPIGQRVERIQRTASELAALIDGQSDTVLSRRPDGKNWAAKEIVCHLRDIEELFMVRFQTMLAMDDPKFLVLGAMPPNPAEWGIGGPVKPAIDPDRWAEERQYLKNDTGPAFAAFRQRREETLAFLGRLTPEQWRRGSRHVTLGRVTYGDWVALMAAHDDNHLGQLKRALEGRA
jgi:hypothetical protein